MATKDAQKSSKMSTLGTKMDPKGDQGIKIDPKDVTKVITNNEARWRNRRQPLDTREVRTPQVQALFGELMKNTKRTSVF